MVDKIQGDDIIEQDFIMEQAAKNKKQFKQGLQNIDLNPNKQNEFDIESPTNPFENSPIRSQNQIKESSLRNIDVNQIVKLNAINEPQSSQNIEYFEEQKKSQREIQDEDEKQQIEFEKKFLMGSSEPTYLYKMLQSNPEKFNKGGEKISNFTQSECENILSQMLQEMKLSGSQKEKRDAPKVMDRDLYLCPPKYLNLEYTINPWMSLQTPFSRLRAEEQWMNLVAIYRELCPENVTLVQPKEGLTELCFFGDSIFAYKNKAIFSRFTHIERFRETEYVMEYAKNVMGIKGVRVPENIRYEGSGETIVWNQRIIVGYGHRSSKEIVDFLAQQYPGTEVIGLELIDGRFYHLDCAFCPLSKDLVAVYEDAFTEESLKIIRSLGCEVMKLDLEDASQFSTNSIVIGKTVVVHMGATKFIKKLREKGFTVIPMDISEFIKFGGGIKCLTFQHWLV